MYPSLSHRDDLLKMLDEMLVARQKIVDACVKLNAEQLLDPVYPGTWSVLKNLAHMAWAERFLMGFVFNRPELPFEGSRPKESALELLAVRTALDEAHAEAIAFLKSQPETVLGEKCLYGLSLRDAREETVGGIYFHIIEHEIGHRAFVLNKLEKLQSPQ